MKNIKENSVQTWLPFEDILEDGIIKLKNNSYIKILKIIPINFNLKSDFEKEAILNSYKLFLKTCNFDIQILIQSNKENINEHIKNIKNNTEKDFEKIKIISNKYCEYVKQLNHKNTSSSKKFYILIKKNPDKINENVIKEELNSEYFKIRECLSRCGNTVFEVSSKSETEEILFSFLRTKDYIKKNQ